MFWGATISSEKPFKLESSSISNLIHISHCSTGDIQAARLQLLVRVEGKEYHLCTLMKDKGEDIQLDHYFHVDQNVEFILRGKGSVDLTGYYEPSEDDEEEEEEQIQTKPKQPIAEQPKQQPKQQQQQQQPKQQQQQMKAKQQVQADEEEDDDDEDFEDVDDEDIDDDEDSKEEKDDDEGLEDEDDELDEEEDELDDEEDDLEDQPQKKIKGQQGPIPQQNQKYVKK